MSEKSALKDKSIKLRKEGHTYSEILKIIPVAKSTLSEWLKSVGLAKAQIQRITEKRRLGQLKGAMARRNQRIRLFNRITEEAERQVGKISKRELLLLGAALYWAEGAKEKDFNHGVGIKFSNSDPNMIFLFVQWLFLNNISRDRIKFNIYVHDSYKNELDRFRIFWSQATGFPLEDFSKIYFKRAKLNTKRRNRGKLYNGLLCVKVSRSSELNRKIQGWVRGIVRNWGIV
jgi:hypothetical protein